MVRYEHADDCAHEAANVLCQTMTREGITPDRFLKQVALDPNFRKEGSILAFLGDKPVGYALTVCRHVPVEGQIIDGSKGYLWLLGVLPEARGRGIGAELLQLAEQYLRDQGKEVCLASPYSPGYFQPGVDVDAYAGGLEFLKKRGYQEVYRPIACQASLWDSEPPDWVWEAKTKAESEGVTFTRDGRFGLSKLLEFAHKEFGPDWAAFVRRSMQSQLGGDRSTGLSIAWQDGRVLGFGHFEGERFGPIGVAASERGRGLGQILMWDILAQQKEAGFRTSWFLWSDDQTLEKLYQYAGYKVARRFALLKKELV